jgi:hypothetical protein
LLIISTVIFLGIIFYQSPIQRKLIGSWNIEFENSYIERDSIYEFTWAPMDITKNAVQLPSIHDTIGAIDFHGKNSLELDEDFWTDEIMEKGKKHSEKIRRDATGTWQIISTNPDTVFFNAPKNPLHGKYAIRFFIDKNGYRNMSRLIYKIRLTNDSTYLICNKGGIIYENSVRNWEN